LTKFFLRQEIDNLGKYSLPFVHSGTPFASFYAKES
jgi:hypothetical protein